MKRPNQFASRLKTAATRPKMATARTTRHGPEAAPPTCLPPPVYGAVLTPLMSGSFPFTGGSELRLAEVEGLPLHAVTLHWKKSKTYKKENEAEDKITMHLCMHL